MTRLRKRRKVAKTGKHKAGPHLAAEGSRTDQKRLNILLFNAEQSKDAVEH